MMARGKRGQRSSPKSSQWLTSGSVTSVPASRREVETDDAQLSFRIRARLTSDDHSKLVHGYGVIKAATMGYSRKRQEVEKEDEDEGDKS
jgi:hypothetical protein